MVDSALTICSFMSATVIFIKHKVSHPSKTTAKHWVSGGFLVTNWLYSSNLIIPKQKETYRDSATPPYPLSTGSK